MERAKQLIEAGIWLRLSGDHDGAKRLFEQALRLDPGNEKAKELMAQSSALSSRGTGFSPLPTANPFELPQDPPATRSAMEVDWGLATGVAGGAVDVRPEPTVPLFEALPEARRSGGPDESVDEALPPVEVAPGPPVEPPPDPATAWRFPTPEPFPVAPPSMPKAPRVPPEKPSPAPQVPIEVVSSSPSPSDEVSIDVDVPNPLEMLSADAAPPLAPPPAFTKDDVKTLLQGVKKLLELDDHSGAMELLLKAQELAPNDPSVAAMKARSESTLLAMYESKLGRLDAVPRVKLKEDEIIWLNLDHRAGFVLAQIDGAVSFDDVFSVSGMSRLDTARILAQLVDEGVISRG